MPELRDNDDWSAVLERVTVLGDHSDQRYSDFPTSDILQHYRIAHTGTLTTGHPYELTRTHQSGSCMIATLEGRGQVFIEGSWVTIPKGHACLLPPFAYNSIKSIEGEQWTFSWVKYLENEGENPIVTELTPVYGEFAADCLHHAISGLYHNQQSTQNRGAENLWVELIQKQVLLFSQPKVKDERIWALWKEVQEDLSAPWTVEQLARKANISTEHLRRLCQKQFGRSAKQQLEYLKMRKARILLSDKRNKIETVAKTLGYYDTASFSNAFKKIMGFRPSKMR